MASFYPHLLLLLCILTKFQVNSSGVLVLEDGYTVTTILDGNKLNINPRSVLPQYSSSDLIILDYLRSTFYTLSLATPEGVNVKKLAGSGREGYADGEVASAVFNKPESFAVDYMGNLYFADKFNHTIRKISKSGVTTIAGGYSQRQGKGGDGPAQDASFCNDLELVFVPQMCALIISDRSCSLIRQINLKAEDCSHGSQSVFGKSSVMALGLILSSLVGLIIGFVLRPYVTSRGGWMLKFCNTIWRRCPTSLGRQLMMLCFDMRNVVVSSTVYLALQKLILLSMSMLSLMLRIKPVEPQTCRKPVTLLDLDHKAIEPRAYIKPVTLLGLDDLAINDRAQSCANQLKDLISFDDEMVSSEENTGLKDDECENADLPAVCYSKVDALIEAHMKSFDAPPMETLLHDHLDCDTSLVRKRY